MLNHIITFPICVIQMNYCYVKAQIRDKLTFQYIQGSSCIFRNYFRDVTLMTYLCTIVTSQWKKLIQRIQERLRGSTRDDHLLFLLRYTCYLKYDKCLYYNREISTQLFPKRLLSFIRGIYIYIYIYIIRVISYESYPN